MSAFIIRSLYGETFSYTTTPYFSDVPADHTFFKYVQKMKDDGLTTVTGTYAVDGIVTRGQMAAFIIRAKYGETFDYTTTPYFTDVLSTHNFFKYVQKMKDAGITAATGAYDVNGTVTRDQMAAFLGRAFLGMGSATTTAVPNIVPAQTPRSIAGAKTWLFAVDDGSPQFALSAESDGQLFMGRLDVTNPAASVSWQRVAGPADTGGVSIADHWHIFAHGYHWIVFSVAGDSASYLLKLGKDFQRLALVPVGHTDGPTNDMFLVAEPDGVAVGHFALGYGHTIHRFSLEANKTGQVRIGGGAFTHSNGSSAIPVDGGYLVFASETMNPAVTGAVRLIRFDASWRPVNTGAVLDEDGTNAAMASAVRLDSGYTIVLLRIRTDVSLRQKAPTTQQPNSLLPDDSGALVRLVLDPNGTIVSRETLVSDRANRPHTTLVGNLLITTWDEVGTARLRVDRIE
jgi:hypothetical protein